MIISVKRDKNTIKLNHDFASAVPEFADVLEDERLGVEYLAYVVYSTDIADDNIFSQLPEEIRKVEVANSLKLDETLLKDKKIKEALKKYKRFVEENIGYKFKVAHLDGMRKIADYVKDKKTLGDEDAKEFSAVLKEMPLILKGKADIEKAQGKESIGIIRGKKQLTLNERM